MLSLNRCFVKYDYMLRTIFFLVIIFTSFMHLFLMILCSISFLFIATAVLHNSFLLIYIMKKNGT